MVDWALDLGNEWRQPNEAEDLSWIVGQPKEISIQSQHAIAYSSSGCSARNGAPIVRLKWTDPDLVALAAD